MEFKIEFGKRARLEAQEMASKARDEAELFKGQNAQLLETQELLVDDILTLRRLRADQAWRGNDYPDYATAVKAISDKYNCKADWGCLQTGMIIDLRSAFILGEGIEIEPTQGPKPNGKDGKTEQPGAREMQWARDFLDYNDLDAEMAQEFAKEAEIDGKIVLTLSYDKKPFRDWPGMISVTFVSWNAKQYKVKANPKDYTDYQELTWDPIASEGEPVAKPETLKENVFVYKKFGGRLDKPNETQPKLQRCLTQIDRLDQALKDLRDIDHLYAAPTPDFEVKEKGQVADILAQIKDRNWKIGKAIVHTGTYSLKGPDAAGIATLVSEIELLCKMISGATGIPIHFLGLLDLLRNRATGDNTRELVNAATQKERTIWRGAYEELIEKAMKMFDEQVNAGLGKDKLLDPQKIRVTINVMTQEHWDHLEKVMIPAALGNIISKEACAGQIPGINMDEERTRAEARKKDQDAADDAAFKDLKKTIVDQDGAHAA